MIANRDVDFSKFAGVVVLTNATHFQEDFYGTAGPVTISGTSYNIGGMVAEEDQADADHLPRGRALPGGSCTPGSTPA